MSIFISYDFVYSTFMQGSLLFSKIELVIFEDGVFSQEVICSFL